LLIFRLPHFSLAWWASKDSSFRRLTSRPALDPRLPRASHRLCGEAQAGLARPVRRSDGDGDLGPSLPILSFLKTPAAMDKWSLGRCSPIPSSARPPSYRPAPSILYTSPCILRGGLTCAVGD
jgi:hypothetical protein